MMLTIIEEIIRDTYPVDRVMSDSNVYRLICSKAIQSRLINELRQISFLVNGEKEYLLSDIRQIHTPAIGIIKIEIDESKFEIIKEKE